MKTTTRNVSIGGVLALLWSMAVSWGGTNGYVQVWGTQDYGMQSVPPAALSNTTALAAGWHHCLALANGRVYAWGDNGGGQTNVDDNAFAGVTAIAAGAKSSAALKNGQIVLWGRADDDSKQADFAKIPANGPYTSIALGANHGLAIREDGTVNAWGDDSVGQVYQTAFWGVGIKAVAAGKEFSMGLNENGQVFVAGNPKNGDGDYLKIQEIPPEATNGVSAIAAGPYHAMALKGGCAWVWGAWKAEDEAVDPQLSSRAAYGNVTNVPEAAKSGVVDIAAGFNTCAALKQDGSVVIWGNKEGSGSVQTIPPCAEKNVKEIALGYRHAMARTSYLPPTLTSETLPDAYLESEYDGQITAIGDPQPTFYVKGSLKLPSGLTLIQETGAITGVPEKTGTNHVTIAATNLYGEDAREFIIVVFPRKTVAPSWITESLPNAELGRWYEVQLEATENPVYSVDSSLEPLPAWATLTSDGVIKGWPEGVGDAYPTFIAANDVGSTNRQLRLSTLNPTEVPVIAGQGTLPDAVKGADYNVILGIQGATDVVVSSGRLPAGLVLQRTDGTWTIAGVPTTAGDDQEFELAASNPAGTTKGTWSIAVKGSPEWVTPEGALSSGRVGVAYTATVEAKWATNYVAESRTWPAGWTLSLKDGSTGKIAEISATPTMTTNVVLGLTAVNAHGSTTPVRYFTVSVLDITVPELEWTGIRWASNTVLLTWTNKTGGDTTAWIGNSTNLLTGWPTNTTLVAPDWIKTNSPATLPTTSGPRFYLLRAL
ncbi:MAG: putative Ig domain-containing protein [Kiritimatiellae bacterium]|nr:putative Ig domain-containing protein [Kiritimatiellia bacterium]